MHNARVDTVKVAPPITVVDSVRISSQRARIVPGEAGGNASPMCVSVDYVELWDMYRIMGSATLTMSVLQAGAWEDRVSTVMAAVRRRCLMELTAAGGLSGEIFINVKHN